MASGSWRGRLLAELRHLLGQQIAVFLVADVYGIADVVDGIEPACGILQQCLMRHQRQQRFGIVFTREWPQART